MEEQEQWANSIIPTWNRLGGDDGRVSLFITYRGSMMADLCIGMASQITCICQHRA